jgi:hypothetical protein
MSRDRNFRSLTSLSGASTSRVLNLLALTGRHGASAEFCSDSFFASPHLNSAIIVKHRLRSDELDIFPDGRANCTKIILAFEKEDLRSGGRSFFVGQRGYEALLQEAGHYRDQQSFNHDLKVLGLIDGIPSLDPFLLREHLNNHDIAPDSRYFEISDADQRRMFEYAAAEISRLTNMRTRPLHRATPPHAWSAPYYPTKSAKSWSRCARPCSLRRRISAKASSAGAASSTTSGA